MMKYIVPIFAIFSFFSCEKDDNNYDALRNNIIGSWEVKHSVQEIRSDTVYSESAYVFDIQFEGDGTGLRSSIFGSDVEFEWYYQYNPEKFVLVTMPSGIIFEDTQVYNVHKNESDSQIWTYDVYDINAVADVYKNTWVMTKK